MSWNLGASTSWNSQGLSRPVMGLLYLFISLPQKCQQVFSLYRYRWVFFKFRIFPSLAQQNCYSSLLSNVLLYMLYKTLYIHYVLVSHLYVSWKNFFCHLWSTLPKVYSHLTNKCCRVKEARNVLCTINRKKLTGLVTSCVGTAL